jgi:hypothetical protein
MTFRPPRVRGILIGFFLLGCLLGSLVISITQLITQTVTPYLGLWTTLIVLATPLAIAVGYQLYGLITAIYILNRDGFYLRWGLETDQIPISSIRSLRRASRVKTPDLRPNFGLWWPGNIVGTREVDGIGHCEFFTTVKGTDSLILSLDSYSMLISPANNESFLQSFQNVVQLGSLEEIPEIKVRPEFFSMRLWRDRLARTLILIGVGIIIALLAYLSIRVPDLPAYVAFGFDPKGIPDLLVPPAQLLLLPLAGGVFWLLDLLLGAWLYRGEENRNVAYVLWAIGICLGLLLWGAVVQLTPAL